MASYVEELFGLHGEVAVVIGGTGVLGGAFCRGLARAGATVVVAGREADRGAATAAELVAAGCRATHAVVDVLRRDSIAALRESTLAAHGRADILVNCAGVNSGSDYLHVADDDWQRVLDINLRGVHWACQVFAEHMVAAGRGGSIINIGSVTAHLPLSRVFAYSCSKAAVVNLTKNLAREFAPHQVRVNAICPGFFPAEQNRELLDAQRTRSILEQTPLARFGEPEELIGALLLLASRRAATFITGAAYYVDGGFTAARF